METSSDKSYNSCTRQKTTKPVTSSNKSFTFPAKHKYDNTKTPLKKNHQNSSTSKINKLESIKQLHINCGFLNTEHLYMLIINWLNHHKVPGVNVDIAQNLYNDYCTLKSFYYFILFYSLYPKIHSPHNYLQSFYVAVLIDECGTANHFSLAMFQNDI